MINMINLAVVGSQASAWGGIGPRLRGACVVLEASGQPTVETEPHAQAVLAMGRVEAAQVEHWLQDGRHVLLSVECGLPEVSLRGLSAVARRSGVQLGIANPGDRLPSRRLVREQLASGRLGTPGLMRLHRWDPLRGDTDEAAEPDGCPAPLLGDLDLCLVLMGRQPNVVYAVRNAVAADAGLKAALVQVHLGFPDGGMALIDYTDGLPTGDEYRSLSVIGSSGAAYADDHQNVQLVYGGGRPQGLRVDEGVLPLVALAQEFVDDLQAGRDLSASVASWCGVLKLGEAVRAALASGRAVQPLWEAEG